jgi:hypothetical protein
MQPRFSNQRNSALTLVEVLVVIAALLLPALLSAAKKAQRISCVNNLALIGSSFSIWEGDYTNLYPMSVSTNLDGANPVPVLVPCHRVLAANKKLGGFSGGLDWKRSLLKREGIKF